MNELKHHGVLGMKWGRRKDRTVSPSSDKPKKHVDQKAVKEKLSNGAKRTATALLKIGTLALWDDAIFAGAGRKAVGLAVKTLGRATITGIEMARGGYDIRWYDN